MTSSHEKIDGDQQDGGAESPQEQSLATPTETSTHTPEALARAQTITAELQEAKITDAVIVRKVVKFIQKNRAVSVPQAAEHWRWIVQDKFTDDQKIDIITLLENHTDKSALKRLTDGYEGEVLVRMSQAGTVNERIIFLYKGEAGRADYRVSVSAGETQFIRVDDERQGGFSQHRLDKDTLKDILRNPQDLAAST